jgi:hypothetical protein
MQYRSSSKIMNSICRYLNHTYVKKERAKGKDIDKLIPRSKNKGRFRHESTGNRWNVEAVFPPGNFRIFSDDFRAIPAGKLEELTGIHRKKNPISSGGNTASISGYFQCFPAGSGDFPASFLQDPAGSGSRNHRSGLL